MKQTAVAAGSNHAIQDELIQLATLIRHECATLLERWRTRIKDLPSARKLDTPTLNDHFPFLIEELADACQARYGSEESLGCPPVHSIQRFEQGFDLMEVITEYKILRECICELAEENGIELHNKAFYILNRVFDDAIAVAVQTFVAQQALEIRRRRDEYLAFVVHDLRTPLNAISLAANALGSLMPQKNENTARMLSILSRNTKRLETLVENVLKESVHAQAEIPLLERREFDLWPMVEELIHDLRPVAEAGGTNVINEIPEGMIVFADASMVKRIFQNLIANAIKHTPGGKAVIGAEDGAEAVECWVKDNGIGIPGDRLGKIFEKGESSENKRDSITNGLGLPIVKTLVEAHGGKVTVNSREGYGAEFRFTLPLRQS
ncbi:MAG TPA: HAMP domain-containing sensor histidine kinase [Gammaproteobacteria bacterium]|nr:HAMP domain-containing sensor histidine kinase [Gammaproteobacteria bacterium]